MTLCFVGALFGKSRPRTPTKTLDGFGFDQSRFAFQKTFLFGSKLLRILKELFTKSSLSGVSGRRPDKENIWHSLRIFF